MKPTFQKWIGQTGFWHEFDRETMRSLCGVHETATTETKTPGGQHCRKCLELAQVPLDHWMWRWAADEPEIKPARPEASTIEQLSSGLFVVTRK